TREAARSGSRSPERSSAAASSRRSTMRSRASGGMRSAILAHGAQYRSQDAVHEAGGVGAAERLRGLDGLVDRAFRRDRLVALDEVGVQHLEQRGPQDGALERRDAVDRP